MNALAAVASAPAHQRKSASRHPVASAPVKPFRHSSE